MNMTVQLSIFGLVTLPSLHLPIDQNLLKWADADLEFLFDPTFGSRQTEMQSDTNLDWREELRNSRIVSLNIKFGIFSADFFLQLASFFCKNTTI